ncbi:hypothetical protein EST92_04910 [Streptomyces sp. TM32]|uniref:DUF6344 domain-containing protein n=1 Tax=Streptomyces sp. TM32 TaxID=1652669 RepID=UPI0010101C76|nr:DUF6344 domain-containing protein [Streptomyces sp. TM32]RXS86878.1 hypothetical protein EST92_04910 [Streptomyces sp. TM32]
MAATKVMKFWAVCLAVLGKLLASLGVSAAASAARRDAALYERTLGKESAGTEAPGAEVPKAVGCGAPDRGPGAGSPSVPAPRGVPLYGQIGSARRFRRPELPPTIKQRILAEAHGTSPGMRSRRTYTAAPLTADACADQDGTATATATTPANAAAAESRGAVIPAARNRAHTAGVI